MWVLSFFLAKNNLSLKSIGYYIKKLYYGKAKNMGKIRNFFLIKFNGMGIGTGMGIGNKEDVEAYKSGSAKSFGSGSNNIFN